MSEPDWLDEIAGRLYAWTPGAGDNCSSPQHDAELIAHAPEDIARLVSEVKRLRAEYAEIWDEGLRAGMDSVLTAHERLADSRADWLPPVPANPYRTVVSDGSE